MQLVYEAVLAVWLLTFHEPAQAAIRAARIIPKLIDVAKSGAKEKVVRVAVLSLKNLFDKYGSDMIEHGLLKVRPWQGFGGLHFSGTATILKPDFYPIPFHWFGSG